MNIHFLMTLSRKERDRQLRVDDFLGAAQQLFAEKGYHATSMEEIARRAEYATGTIYRYFKDKEDLYSSLLEREAQALLEHVEEELSQFRDSRERIKGLIQAHVDFYFQHQDFFRLFIASGQLIDPTLGGRASERIYELHRQANELMNRVLAEAMEDGTIRPMSLDLICRGLAGLTEGVLSQWLMETSQLTTSEITEFIFQLLWDGIRIPKALS